MEFSYDNPTAIEFGKGKIKELSNKICKDKKILLVYGGGSIKNNGVYDQVVKALENHTYIEFSGVEVNPTVETMNKAVKIIKEENIDFILAVGGGSVIDGCKYLAAAALYDGDGWDFLDGTAEVEKALLSKNDDKTIKDSKDEDIHNKSKTIEILEKKISKYESIINNQKKIIEMLSLNQELEKK